ncbi:myosin heavy chain, skeletal muscle-like isoform X3 [Sitophilus oryzae]|uniref:Myosin heavy chain, skeletal muscle-like isoform X3 n=1 Tax=Sitophilus oryzae TaxID=7048 RepID=A0A6J2XF93_SITOR|nr:myosin heavy chain, skeletal muscle-like isoform X3 [Sitophilus oryzae]
MSLNQSRGCPVSVGNTICGEANSLDIMKEFNRLYEDKMQQVDSEAGGDCSQEKIKLQQEWIRNLTQQNEMLVKAVQELEYEATERVKQLEDKLQKSAQCLCEVMRKYREHDFTTDLLSEPLQKISNLEDDIRNVLEFIRRIRENGDWNTDGLFFHKIKNVDLLGTNTASVKEITTTSGTDEGEKLLNEKERTVIDLTEKLHYYKTFGDVESMAKELECKREEYNSLKETSQVIIRQKENLSEKISTVEKENLSLKDTLQAEKGRIEELEGQFKEFLISRDDLKHKNKILEKRIKQLNKEKEGVACECEALKGELRIAHQENDKLLADIRNTHGQLNNIRLESAKCQCAMKDIIEENKKAIEQILTLNEENRTLSHSIEVLRQRNEVTTSFTQDEISKLTDTIEELHLNLERTKIAQEAEERSHQNEIAELNNTIHSLEYDIKDLQERSDRETKICKICRGRSKVGFLETTEVQVSLGTKESEIRKALDEVNHLKSNMRVEIERKDDEIKLLRSKVNELELALRSCEERATNLQEAVTLYSNSINILESAEKQANVQIQQQKVTITNLQQALVAAKHELEEITKKYQDNIFQEFNGQKIIKMLESELNDVQYEYDAVRYQLELISTEHQQLQDNSFDLEVDHCDSLQDIDMLEDQLNKYKSILKGTEAECNRFKDQIKKLSKQKCCYEEIITYFKHEMGLMAEQLNNLQELLTLSNESAHQESSKIMQAFTEVQTLNEKLSNQLCACEEKVQLESQTNQLHEAKITELQQLINEKELDLTKHDRAILNIRQTLNESLKQNEELQNTIFELNKTILDLQEAVKRYEQENGDSRKSTMEFQQQIGSYCNRLEELKRGMDDKNAECLKLEMAYNNEKRALKAAQKQLQETERQQQENQMELIGSLEDLKRKLADSSENNNKLSEECETLQKQLANLTRKEAVKDLEIKRYRKIVGDLKKTMMELNSELNKNLIQKELKASCKSSTCNRSSDQTSKSQEICDSCPCEVEFYHRMIDMLKKSVIDLKRLLNETEEKNTNLEQEVKQKDVQISDLKQANDELNQQIQQSDSNDANISNLEKEIDRLKQELEVKTSQLDDVKKTAQEINGSKCIQLACAQEEMASLKTEISNILNRQYSLKRENEEMQKQTAQFHCSINCLSEQNKVLKEQIEQYVVRMKNLNTEKETLVRKNRELLNELRSLQSTTFSMDKQQRHAIDSLKQMESDVEDLKQNKEEICLESKNVIKNVRAWVEEQKIINDLIIKREQMYLDTIKKMSADKQPACKKVTGPRPCTKRYVDFKQTTPWTSPCSLGSQGTASVYDDSPPASPDVYSGNDWYSSTFKTESENDSGEEYCVNTLENLTQQMRNTSKMWNEKRACTDCKFAKEKK